MLPIRFAARAGLAVAFTFIASRSSAAQSTLTGASGPFHVIVLSTGVTMMKVDPLNARLVSSQFASLSNGAVSYGGGGYFAVGRALLGAEAQRSIFGEEGLNNGRSNNLHTMQALATVGYAIVTTERLTVFPQLGVSFGRVRLTLRDRTGASTSASEPTFDEIVRAPGNESQVDGQHLLYSFGGGADYLTTRRGVSTGVVIGVRAGLAASPNRATWTRDGERVVAAPDAGADGPYLRVMVGFGAR